MKYNFLTNRISAVRNLMKIEKCDSLLLTSQESIRFISDFAGTFGVIIITKNDLFLLSDGRYVEELQSIDERFEKIHIEINYLDFLEKNKLLTGETIGFEADNLSVSSYFNIKNKFQEFNFKDISSSLSIILSQHDEESLNRTKKAISISKKVLKNIKPKLITGVTEKEIASEISYLHKIFSADKDAFEPIVAFGENSAKPHAVPGKRKLKNNDIILIDLGCIYKGLCSDITRTYFHGNPSSDFIRLKSIVNSAAFNAIELLKPNENVFNIDRAARDFIAKAGYGDFFMHSLGHGIGYKVHSFPIISQKYNIKLFNNFVVTIEPGIYIPNFGGIRIENDYLITNSETINLTNFI